MKTLRFALLLLLLTGLPATGRAQTGSSDPGALQAAETPAREAFDRLKTLAGSWVGRLVLPQDPKMDGRFAQFSMRVTSMGNAFVHELSLSGRPDHPLTMFHLEDDRLVLTHYCDAGNRPHMQGTISEDGKRVEFEFVDVDGPLEYGHMYGAVFTFIDDDHHTEEWTWKEPGGKLVQVRFDLERTNFESDAAD